MPIDPSIKALVSAIGQAETGPSSPTAYTKPGASGEYGRYQFMPDTWKANSKEAGVTTPLAQSSVEDQNKVAYFKVKQWKDAGYNPAQIASMWNAGPGKPNAYKEGWKGVHVLADGTKVPYDTPAYAAKVSKYYQQNKGQTQQSQSSGFNPSPFSSPGSFDFSGMNTAATGSQSQSDGSFVGDVGKTIGDAGTGVSNAVKDTMSGKINLLSGAIQGVGSIAGGISGLVGNTLEHTPIVGNIYKGITGALGQGIGALAQTDAGKSVAGGIQTFTQQHPELAGDIGGIGNIVGLVGGGIGGVTAKEAGISALKSAATKGLLGTTAKSIAENSAAKIAAKLLESNPTKKEIQAAVRSGRATMVKGVPTILPDAGKVASQEAVTQLVKEGKITSKMTATQSAQVIKDTADNAAKEMRDLLRSQEVAPIVQPEELQGLFQRVTKEAGTALTNGEKPAQHLLKVFADNLPRGRDITAEDILNARQAVSRYVLQNKGDWRMKGVQTGFLNARDAFWNASKDLLISKAPNVPVEALLGKQSTLYKSLDYVSGQVAKELGSTRAERYLGRHPVQKGLVKLGKGAVRYGLQGAGFGIVNHLIE